MKNLALFIALVSLPELSFGQSGWVKEKNKLYTQLSFSTFTSDQYYNTNGDLLRTSEFSQQSVLLYGEYGLGKNFALTLNYVGYRWNGFETTETVSGSGDLFVGLQYALIKGKFPLSIMLGPEIPLAKANRFAQNKFSSFDRINLPTGDGEWNVKATLALSHKFENIPVYASVYSSFNYRTEYAGVSFNNQLKSGVEIGYEPISRLWIQAKLHVFSTLGKTDGAIDFIRGEGTAFTSTDFSVAYGFTKRWYAVANVALYSDLILARKNLYSAPNYTFGIAYKID